MKAFFYFILLFRFSASLQGQNLSGAWGGMLKLPGKNLRIIFNIYKTENGIRSTMDSPDQGALGIPTTTTSFESSILKISIDNMKIEFIGTLNKENTFIGKFNQNGQSFPLILSNGIIKVEKALRPQEPTKPYPYYTEDITFENKIAKISLAGTLTLPQKEGFFPVVILISGSGPQNRNEEIFEHKPFLVLSDFLTKNGIAVLRFDDRGTALSKGDFKTATSVEFATDVEAGIEYLKSRKEINKKKIGLIGHSEGGIIAPMVAIKSKNISFIVLLAGTGIKGDQLLLLQQKLLNEEAGVSAKDIQKSEILNRKIFEIVNFSENKDRLTYDLENFIKKSLKDSTITNKPDGISDETFVKSQIEQITSPWMQFFIKYDPAPTLEKIKCPVLAINGGKDLQVPPKENLEAIKKALIKGKNKKVTIMEIPNLNHLFQDCKTGSPNEYNSITQTFSPLALIEILNWVQKQIL